MKAAYFTAVNGNRNAIFILDMPSADMMPVIAEPFFQMGASVEFFPTMNLEDLKKGLSAGNKVKILFLSMSTVYSGQTHRLLELLFLQRYTQRPMSSTLSSACVNKRL